MNKNYVDIISVIVVYLNRMDPTRPILGTVSSTQTSMAKAATTLRKSDPLSHPAVTKALSHHLNPDKSHTLNLKYKCFKIGKVSGALSGIQLKSR